MRRTSCEPLEPISVNVTTNGNSNNNNNVRTNNLSPESPKKEVLPSSDVRSISPARRKGSRTEEDNVRSSDYNFTEVNPSSSPSSTGIKLQSPNFTSIHPALFQTQTPFFSAAASLFLNSPLIPSSQWLYSRIYNHGQPLTSTFSSEDFVSSFNPKYGLPAPEPKRILESGDGKLSSKRTSSPIGNISLKKHTSGPESPKKKSPSLSPGKRLLNTIKQHKTNTGETPSKTLKDVWRPY